MLGFIPAPAGNRVEKNTSRLLAAVHPRACGEQRTYGFMGGSSSGSSPRLRGTVEGRRRGRPRQRFIPAPAGNRIRPVSRVRAPPVHPRACGEQGNRLAIIRTSLGSSPRLRGTGLLQFETLLLGRFIPAPAGNRPRPGGAASSRSVHPRACGEQSFRRSCLPVNVGSSPRLRGTADRSDETILTVRFIPAPAGNSDDAGSDSGHTSVHPRACGEQARREWGNMSPPGSSPRLRGTASYLIIRRGLGRFIPAPAGNSPPRRTCHPRPPVHPRACGEQ